MQQIKLVDELREIRFRANEISGIEERIKRLESIAEKTTPTMQEGSRGTATQDRMAETVAKAVDLAEVLKIRVVEYESRVQAVEQEVDKLPPNFRAVIRYRDFEGMHWEEVANAMLYSIQHCKRIYGYAKERIRCTTIRCDTMRRETVI